MASEKLELFGEFMYPQVFEINRDKKGPNGAWEDVGGACKVTLLMDKENYEKFKASGSRLKVNETEDGRWSVVFRRYFENDKFPNLGGPPKVARIDGSPWDIDEDGLIGNGSTGILRATVYDTNTGKGTRLDGIQVVEHVVYESSYDPNATGFSDLSDLAEGKKVKEKAKKAKVPESSDPEDEIPF